MKKQGKLFQNGERNYVELLHAGNKAQFEKLYENSHKSGFENNDLLDLYNLLEEEVGELWSSIDDQLLEDIRREAADVANYAHMIIYQCDAMLKGASKTPSDEREGA